jgi:hypothetical protein
VATDIRIGTASWTDPGFIEDWYPPKLPASARLRWYSEHFNYVEVNATFYAIPTAQNRRALGHRDAGGFSLRREVAQGSFPPSHGGEIPAAGFARACAE